METDIISSTNQVIEMDVDLSDEQAIIAEVWPNLSIIIITLFNL